MFEAFLLEQFAAAEQVGRGVPSLWEGGLQRCQRILSTMMSRAGNVGKDAYLAVTSICG
jgi:hypothetical protein